MGTHPTYEEKHGHVLNKEPDHIMTPLPTGSRDMIVVCGMARWSNAGGISWKSSWHMKVLD